MSEVWKIDQCFICEKYWPEDKMTKTRVITRTMKEKEPVKYVCPDCKKVIEHEPTNGGIDGE